MEVNKDEAERCIEIAIEAIKAGNGPRAEKFLKKAESLFPSQKARGEYIISPKKVTAPINRV